MDYKKKINEIKQSLNNDRLSERVDEQMKIMKEFTDKQQYEYLNCLLYPEKSKGCKIPSKVPIPSTTFQLKKTWKPLINVYGENMFFYNPYLIVNDLRNTEVRCFTKNEYTASRYISSTICPMWVMDDSTRIEDAGNNAWDAISDPNVHIKNLFSCYRLVSASINVRYIGDLSKASGWLGGGILLKNMNYIPTRTRPADSTGVGSLTGFPAKDLLGPYKDLRQSTYYHESNVLEGLRCLYFPVDNSYNEFIPFIKEGDLRGENPATVGRILLHADPKKIRCGFWWFVETRNLPESSRCIVVDICCNFECLPLANYTPFLYVSVTPKIADERLLRRVIEEVQKRCVTKLIDKY